MDLQIKRLSPLAIMPEMMTEGAAGLDLCAAIDEIVTIAVGEVMSLGTGLAMCIPEGYVGLIFPRSGLSTREGIVLANSVAVIDSDYRGEVGLPLLNRSDRSRVITPGQRVAQMVIMPYAKVKVCEVDDLPTTNRGIGGFGSTGK